MLLACPSCNSKYLLNSAELKPDGKRVKCVKCEHEWFQEPNIKEEGIYLTSEPLDSNEELIKKTQNNLNKNNEVLFKQPSNLPSTYVEITKPNIVNSILVLVLVILFLFILWSFNNYGSGVMILANYYLQEFYFNLKLIINDLAKIINQILN